MILRRFVIGSDKLNKNKELDVKLKLKKEKNQVIGRSNKKKIGTGDVDQLPIEEIDQMSDNFYFMTNGNNGTIVFTLKSLDVLASKYSTNIN